MYLVLHYKRRILESMYLFLRFLLLIIQKGKDDFTKIEKYPGNESLPFILLNFFVYGAIEVDLRSLRFK